MVQRVVASTVLQFAAAAGVLLVLLLLLHQRELTENSAISAALSGHVLQIRLLLDPKRSGKWSDAKDHVGLTVSIKPTWVDRKDDEPVSEMSEQVLRVCLFAGKVHDSVVLSLRPVSGEHEQFKRRGRARVRATAH